jgi:nucleotidyltransferase/DNA polymerase involved in DNA repair
MGGKSPIWQKTLMTAGLRDYKAEAKPMSREQTFQQDITVFSYLKDASRSLVKELSLKIRFDGVFAHTVTLKAKYAGMKLITLSKSSDAPAAGP